MVRLTVPSRAGELRETIHHAQKQLAFQRVLEREINVAITKLFWKFAAFDDLHEFLLDPMQQGPQDLSSQFVKFL